MDQRGADIRTAGGGKPERCRMAARLRAATPRADVEPVREDIGIRVKGSAPGGFTAELDVTAAGTGHSPTAKAVTMLILVATACLAAITFSAISWLAHAPALVLVLVAAITFAGVLLTGAIIAFRKGEQPIRPASSPAPATWTLERARQRPRPPRL
jgi:hypothetical protein